MKYYEMFVSLSSNFLLMAMVLFARINREPFCEDRIILCVQERIVRPYESIGYQHDVDMLGSYKSSCNLQGFAKQMPKT